MALHSMLEVAQQQCASRDGLCVHMSWIHQYCRTSPGGASRGALHGTQFHRSRVPCFTGAGITHADRGWKRGNPLWTRFSEVPVPQITRLMRFPSDMRDNWRKSGGGWVMFRNFHVTAILAKCQKNGMGSLLEEGMLTRFCSSVKFNLFCNCGVHWKPYVTTI